MKKVICILSFTACIWMSCAGGAHETPVQGKSVPLIFPDYTNVTIPYNIAPLNFAAASEQEEFQSATLATRHSQFQVRAHNGFIRIPSNKWNALLANAKGDSVAVTVVSRSGKQTIQYPPFYLYVSPHPIDPYIAYRLIEPLYALWHEMGIYQRNLESFDETPIYENKLSGYNCVNCHAFCMQSADKMMFHMRGNPSGTLLIDGQQVESITPQIKGIPNLTYPAWHPSGRFIAYSVNDTYQTLHPTQRIEVYDVSSDIVIYDREQRNFISTSSLCSPTAFETFPSFSPDGKTLYYCSAKSQTMPDSIQKLQYNLCSITFDPTTQSFGQTDTLYNASTDKGSVSFPRVSPDGRFLMYTLSGYATFPIWHDDADLYQINLQTKEKFALSALNSNKSESYHSWSSNSHWVVFASRRIDGLHTRPFIAYIDETGKAAKPFLLPQKEKDFYTLSMKSYNIPELVKGKVTVRASQIAQKAKNTTPITTSFTSKKAQ